ncbi:unnamed protein product, partial [Brachionus calyciflorus]
MKNLQESSPVSINCKFSAKNYKNLDPIKSSKRLNLKYTDTQTDANINILPDVKIKKVKTRTLENDPIQLGSLVGSKLLMSVKDLRKSIKNLIAIQEEQKKTKTEENI